MLQAQAEAAILIQVFKPNCLFRPALIQATHKYNISQYKVNTLTHKQILEIHTNIAKKHYFDSEKCSEDLWYGNELRVYIWFLVCYGYWKQKCVSQLTEPDWMLLSKIFNGRSLNFLEFQARLILKLKGKSKKWLQHQTQLLTKIIDQSPNKNRWNCISRELFQYSGRKYFRSPKQCREHWINYLDPNIKKSEWGLDEDYKLMTCVGRIGPKWARISKLFDGTRTENMVKNRFKSLCRKYNKNNGDEVDEDACLQMMYMIKSELSKHSNHHLFQKIGPFDIENYESPQLSADSEYCPHENSGPLKDLGNFHTNYGFCELLSNEMNELQGMSLVLNADCDSSLERYIQWQ